MFYRILYNIFKFESFIRVLCHYPAYVLFERSLVTSISDTKDQNEIFQFHVIELLRHRRGTTAPRFVGITMIFLLATPWNLVCAIFQISNSTIWFAGWICASVVAFVLTTLADNPRKYLKDFQKYEMKTQKGIWRSAIFAFFIMIVVWVVHFLSFFSYLTVV